jgi:hypothetical protein
MLLDTGASHCSLSDAIIAQLGLQPTGSIQMHTPSTGSTPVTAATYDVDFVFQGHNGQSHALINQAVNGCNLSAQGIDGLLGRDFMSAGRLTYSGPDSFCYLSF